MIYLSVSAYYSNVVFSLLFFIDINFLIHNSVKYLISGVTFSQVLGKVAIFSSHIAKNNGIDIQPWKNIAGGIRIVTITSEK